MNILMNRLLGSAALVALLGAGCMQGAVQAQFHLPMRAHWGQAILAPGDYRVKILDLNSGPNQIVIEGQGKTVFQMVQNTDPNALSDKSSLQLVKRDGEYFVKAYKSGYVGKTFRFGVPKAAVGATETVEIAN
jgi:hypothetical protein